MENSELTEVFSQLNTKIDERIEAMKRRLHGIDERFDSAQALIV
ncbi:hypothetical protein ACUL41_15990 [Virgibacillus natechei]